jgi:membrane protein required for colicin V production
MSLAWVDLLLLVLLLASVLVGAWRGLVFELLSLAGWLVAYFGAPHLAPVVAGWLEHAHWAQGMQRGASIVLAFLLILVLWSLGAKLIRALIHASPLSVLDRFAGLGFGVLRGLLLCLLLVVVVGMTPLVQTSTWQASRMAPWFEQLLLGLKPMLPDEVLKFVEV